MTGGFWKTIMFIRVWCSLVLCVVFAVSGLVFRFFYISRFLKFHTINWRISPTRTTTWMSQEVCKRLGSVGYTSNFSHLEVGEITHLLHLPDSGTSKHASIPLFVPVFPSSSTFIVQKNGTLLRRAISCHHLSESKRRFCNEALKEGGENVMKTSLGEVTCLDATPIFGVHNSWVTLT